MNQALVVCAGCHRHHRSSEPACPFCGTAVGAPSSSTRPGALQCAVIAAALAFAATQRAEAQVNPVGSPRIGMEHAPAAGYGAPPGVGPLEQQMPQEVVIPAGSTLFELSRGAVRGDARRPVGRWSSDLVIRTDGTWSSGDRSGRLRGAQLASLRAAIARTRLRNAPRPAITCMAIPTRAERVTVGVRSVSWTSPCGTAPDASVTRLVTLAQRLTVGSGG